MTLQQQLYTAGLPCFPCTRLKGPAIPKGTSWQDEALKGVQGQHWNNSGVVGVPIPQGVVVLDLDTYKGVTREQVEQALGVALPWDAALIQHTQGGGQHYAFKCDWTVVYGSNIASVKGFDTRVTGKGYIATGAGYSPAGFGVFALANPAALPTLPDACRPTLEHVERTLDTSVLPEGDRDVDAIRTALRYVDPACDRTEWVKIGLALRHHFHDDELTGYQLFDEWSSGQLTATGEPPHNYVPDVMESQFLSFKPEGGTTIGTLFGKAIEKGYTPPASINTALAFGPNAASEDVFSAVVDNIIESGADPKHTHALIEKVNGLQCDPLQRSMLKATLVRELKDADLLTKEVKQLLDGGAKAEKPKGLYGTNHTENAVLFLDTRYPDSTLRRSEQVWYSYTGKAWEERSDDDIRHEVAVALAPSMPQASVISGTVSMMQDLCAVKTRIGTMPARLVIVQNGVLDLDTGVLLPHDKEFFTTNLLPWEYNIKARCDTWKGFLNETLEGDQERIALLQEWFGYMLTNDYSYHKIMHLLGAQRSGKGTIGRVLHSLVGDENFSGGTLVAMADNAFIESLQTKTVMFIGDAAKKVPANSAEQITERLKLTSGYDAQPISRKFKSNIQATLPTRITIASNHTPRLFDDSGALADRMLIIPFNVSALGREDPTLYDKLVREIEGVAMWALAGLARLRQNGRFTAAAASLAEREVMDETLNPLAVFLKQCCTVDEDAKTPTGDLYNAYTAWCLGQQEDNVLSRRVFTSNVKDNMRGKGVTYGPQRIGDEVVKGFKGLKINHPVTNQQSIPLTAVK